MSKQKVILHLRGGGRRLHAHKEVGGHKEDLIELDLNRCVPRCAMLPYIAGPGHKCNRGEEPEPGRGTKGAAYLTAHRAGRSGNMCMPCQFCLGGVTQENHERLGC